MYLILNTFSNKITNIRKPTGLKPSLGKKSLKFFNSVQI